MSKGIMKQPNGRKRLQYTGADGRVRQLHLGKMDTADAEAFGRHVRELIAAEVMRRPPQLSTCKWVAELPHKLREKMARHGLVESIPTLELGRFVSEYIASRTDAKPLTVAKWRTTETLLTEFFPPATNLRSLTPADGDRWERWLRSERGENTVRKHNQIAKLFLNAAVKDRLIQVNPFDHLRSTTVPNPERFHYVSRADADRLLAACPDNEWKLIIALARFGGLRCPSEMDVLRWEDINWADSRMSVSSPKTEHHIGKAYRVVPLFPEILPYLEQQFEDAPEGAEFVLHHYRGQANLRTRMLKIVRRAGLKVWPKIFQNLRSTRETELLDEGHKEHVVFSWIGNSKTVAHRHYLQITDEDFQKATQKATQQVVETGCK